MIPTTVSSSPSTATSSNCISGNSTNNSQQNSLSVMIGIASLILEGRGVAEEDNQTKTQRNNNLDGIVADLYGEATGTAVGLGVGAGSGSGSGTNNGRQSPMPSTSRAATNSVINITTNPNAFGYAHFSEPLHSSQASSLAESTHQRWAQKLCQLRQASPAASLSSAYEQKIAIEAQSAKVEPEIVALPIGATNRDARDFEIVRRGIFNRHNANTSVTAASAAAAVSATSTSASGTDNFLLSLQSLATTCLRGSSPTSETVFHYTRQTNTHVPAVGVAETGSKYNNYRATPPRFLSPFPYGSGVQSPRQFWSPVIQKEKFLQQQTTGRVTNSTAVTSSGNVDAISALCSVTTTAKGAKYPLQGPHCDQFLRKMGLGTPAQSVEYEDHICDMSILNITCSRWRAYCLKIEAIILRGEPLCIEVFLGPAGHNILLEQWIITTKEKVPPPTMTLTSLCSAIRSQLYFSQISAWCDLIKNSDKTIYDTGRLIYPSPTGAAGDLATHPAGNSTNTNVTPSTSPSSTSSPLNQVTNAMLNQRPRLNIFYRVKQYDATACFNSKPNVHNFPSVNISENCSISICLKSLPRINGGIPKIGTTMHMTGECSNPANNAAAGAGNARLSRTAAKVHALLNCDIKNARRINPIQVEPAIVSKSGATIGKQRCTFYIDQDNELGADEVECACDEDNDNDFDSDAARPGVESTNAINSNSTLSHREKQLMKYRKRMLKRDKKQRKPLTYTSDNSMELSDNKKQNNINNKFIYQPMEECEKESLSNFNAPMAVLRSNNHVQMISTGTQTPMTCCQECGSEKALVCLNCTNKCDEGNDSQSELDEMDSCSSISSSDIIHTPRNQAELLLQAIQRTPKAAKNKKQIMRSKAAMPTCAKPVVTTKITTTTTAILGSPILQNNNHLSVTPMASGANCHVCKRQKTQHNFSVRSEESGEDAELLAEDEDDDDVDGKADVDDEHVVEGAAEATDNIEYTTLKEEEEEEADVEVAATDIMEQEIFMSSTKLTPYIDRCKVSLSSPTSTPNSAYIVLQERSGADKITSTNGRAAIVAMVEKQFKTPTSEQQQQSQQNLSKKPNLLQITRNYNNEMSGGDSNETTPPTHNRLFLRKGLPKVNLTPIFCDPAATMKNSFVSPIPISCPTTDTTFTFDVPTTNGNCKTPTLHSAVDIPVQKSFSAPTLPNSPSLSPRFAKQAAIYKRRSRHLSDRSDRSSLGSDEQFSDEDLECGIHSPATSPMKNRIRMAAMFARAPLLGNLEEALLQKRLMPKTEVMGFKILLGASGLFCPPQLTIPANAYFYELHGETLSTPYLCDVRLPRKGYTVPRCGTVQATLLNPTGTVVRMFVIPYDMRDMPTMHHTFIRQRILADASESTVMLDSGNNNNNINNNNNNNNNNSNNNNNNSNSNKNSKDNGKNVKFNFRLSPNGGLHSQSNLGHFISAEDMKRLRYSIHLRFQTSRSGRLVLYSDIRLLISRRTDCDTAAAHAKGVLEAPNDLITDTIMPINPKYSARQENSNKI